MPSIVKTLRAVADANRLRILLLLEQEELTVAELQEILGMGQSTISTHLSQLKQAALVEDRRTGKNNLYRLVRGSAAGGEDAHEVLGAILTRALGETPEAEGDRTAMRRVVKKRQDRMRAFFDSMAGRLGKDYVPGKSWKGMAEALLRLLPRQVVADLGAGDGSFALSMAARAERVIAVDSSARMLEVGREQAARQGVGNVDFRMGDMEEVPVGDASIDVAFFSQSLHHALHPGRAIEEAFRILKPGGRVVILDLAKHRFEEARDLYADEHLGFTEAELEDMLEKAGFTQIEALVVDRDAEMPQFQTVLATGDKKG